MSREVNSLSADVRALFAEPGSALVLASAPLSHAQRVNATPLRPLSVVAVPEAVLVNASDEIESNDIADSSADSTDASAVLGVIACAEAFDASVECAAHVRENGRCTLSVQSTRVIVHLYSRDAFVIDRSDARFVRIAALLAQDAAEVRDFIVLRVDSIRESMLGAKQTELDASIDGLPALRTAAVARAYARSDERKRSDLSSVQSVPPVVDDGLDPSQQVFELLDEPRPPRSRRQSGLVQLDTVTPPKADTFTFVATALLIGFTAGYLLALARKQH